MTQTLQTKIAELASQGKGKYAASKELGITRHAARTALNEIEKGKLGRQTLGATLGTALPYHPLANLFPLIEGAEFDALVLSVKTNGLREPIIVCDGQVLDGRNRMRACEAADVSCRYELFPPDQDPLQFVIDKNLKRRHLNESQRAFVAAKIANYEHGGDRRSDQAANLPVEKSEMHVRQADAAKLLNVSERSVRSATAVRDEAVPELQRAVERGMLRVSAAARAVKLEPEKQRKIAQAAEAGDPNAARTVIKQERRASRERALGTVQTPTGKFGVIVEDFEWDHETWSDKGRDRAAENHYPVSKDAHTAQEIVERTKDRFACAADDCVLWMWAPLQHAAIAMDVLRMRGFVYKSQYAWGKDKIGLGYWGREKHEILLIGVKGDIDCPAPGTQRDSLIMAPRGEHSAKPECFLEMIEQYFPTLPKIELNRRGPARPGWAAWGNESEPQREAAE